MSGRARTVIEFAGEFGRQWSADDVLRRSAALAYYAMLSLAPLLVLAITIVGRFFGEEAVRGQLEGELTSVVGETSAQAVQEMMKGAAKQAASGWSAVTSGVLSLVGAAGVFREMKKALNDMWETQDPPQVTWKFRVVSQVLPFGMVLATFLLLLASVLVATALQFLQATVSSWVPISPVLWSWVGVAVGFAGETVLFALIFKVLPAAKFPWRDVWQGAAITALLFEVGKWGLSLYLGRESMARGYGAASSVILLLMWCYYLSVIILTGAEFTQVWTRWHKGHGTRPEPLPERTEPRM